MNPETPHAERLARQLLGIAAEYAEIDRNFRSEPLRDGDWRPWVEALRHDPASPQARIGAIVRELRDVLSDSVDHTSSVAADLTPSERWTLGSSVRSMPPRDIHAGYLSPQVRVPFVEEIPFNVVELIIRIQGEKDVLKREHHAQIGWHYHYLDFKKRRSNVILCWDTRATGQRPLYHEHHGEGRADFSARPDVWGRPKRESLYESCAPDLNSWPIETFRPAADDALLVWPPKAKPTPIPRNAKA